jgi:SAM-dependent methyltransferase
MVHALREIHRVLIPGGILIDLRPLDERWPVEVTSKRETRQIGRLLDFDCAIASDESANRAVDQMAAEGRFAREDGETFPFFYYWDTPNEMQEYIAEEWADYNGLEEATVQAARSAWAVADADSRVRIRMKMIIARWIRSK